MNYPGRKLEIFEFIGATASEFRFFMRLRTYVLQCRTNNIRTERLMNKLYLLSIKCKIANSFLNQLLHFNVCRYGLHYNVLLGLMTSVQEEVKGLTKKLYFVTLSRTKTSFHAKVQVHGSQITCYETDVACIIMTHNQLVSEQIICLCTSSEEHLFTCKISCSLVMVSEFRFFKKEDDDEERGQFVKIRFSCTSYLV